MTFISFHGLQVPALCCRIHAIIVSMPRCDIFTYPQKVCAVMPDRCDDMMAQTMLNFVRTTMQSCL